MPRTDRPIRRREAARARNRKIRGPLVEIASRAVGAISAGLIIPLVLFVMAANTGVLRFSDVFGIGRRLVKRKIRRLYDEHPGADSDPEAARGKDASFSPERLAAILKAFEEDGYDTTYYDMATVGSRIGLRLRHRSARSTWSPRSEWRDPEAVRPREAGAKPKGEAKSVYYLEGSHFEMGKLLGLLAENEVRAMSVDFVNNVIFSFFGERKRHNIVGAVLADFVYLASLLTHAKVPSELKAELYGIWAGAMKIDPGSSLRMRSLLTLNYGIDVILGFVLAGADPILRFFGLDIDAFEIPAACNAFAAYGNLTKDNAFFFGRDFMFATAGVFGDTAAHFVYNCNGYSSPRDAQTAKKDSRSSGSASHPRPEVRPSLCGAFGAPGMVGAVAIMNQSGLAMGVDMVAGRNASWRKTGLNSLMMLRHTVQTARDYKEAIRIVARAPRGITWIYVLADAPRDFAGILEAGMKTRNKRFRRYLPRAMRRAKRRDGYVLPSRKFISEHSSGRFLGGLMVRSSSWRPDPAWHEFNPRLFDFFQRQFDQSAWGENGFLVRKRGQNLLPAAFYFAPLRTTRDELLIVSNHFLIPEMRLLCMNHWTVQIPSMEKDYDDFQWRYDSLNEDAAWLLGAGPLDWEAARELISFLKPYDTQGKKTARFDYYGLAPDKSDLLPDEIPIGGSTSLFDLSRLRMETHYNWFSDPWVGLSLRGFLALAESWVE